MKIKTSEGEQNVTSQSQGTINTVLAAIGAAGALTMGGGLLDRIGGGRPQQPQNDGDRPVTRYEMSLIREAMSKDNEITLLKSQQYTDKAMFGVQQQFSAQTAWNTMQQQNIATIQQQLGDITKFVVPITSIDPVPATATESSTQSNG